MTWKASSAACPSRRMRRQTPSTIVPCRAISTSNAAPDASPDARNRSSSCASLRLPSAPSRKSTSSGRAVASVESLAIPSIPRLSPCLLVLRECSVYTLFRRAPVVFPGRRGLHGPRPCRQVPVPDGFPAEPGPGDARGKGSGAIVSTFVSGTPQAAGYHGTLITTTCRKPLRRRYATMTAAVWLCST